jgi:4-amino-4-deoxy-L-arabinose transferase-like glycosyltransferase
MGREVVTESGSQLLAQSITGAKPVRWRARLLMALALTLVIAVHIAGSLWWIDQNITLVGRDAAGHLDRSVRAADALSTLSVRSLFTAVTLTDDYRPPLLYLLSAPFYRLFGIDKDAAQYTNVMLLGAILLLTFVVARRFVGEGWALVATLLTGLLPMTTAMSRLYYMENLLTALILLNLWTLLKGQGFGRRGPSLLWGVSLGLALLTKWTAPIYLLAPTLYVLWGERQTLWSGWNLRWDWRRVLLALILAVGLVAVWWLPNRELAAEFRLGEWLPILWGVIFFATCYALSLPAGRLTNLVSAVFVALAVASLWYLPQIDFTSRLSDVAFGTDRGTQEALDLTRLDNYTRYFGYWLSHHMGPLATLLILPPALYGWWRRWRAAGAEDSSPAAANHSGPESTTILWLMLLSAYLFLALIAQANPRNLNALLPVVAILLVDSLRVYPRALAGGLAAVWMLVLGLQWAIYTADGLAPLFARTPSLWVQGDYLAWPATGSSDPGYWIQPDVLATIGNPPVDGPESAASFGMLSDAWELHRGSFRYLIAAQKRNINLMALTEANSRGWSDLLANQWVLLKTGDNSPVHPTGQQVIERILAGDPLFGLLYGEVKRYPLPNGDEAILYQRAEGPAHPYRYPVVLIETQPLAETINRFWSTGATLYFGNRDTATWVGIHDLVADQIILPAAGADAATVLAPVRGTIFAVTRYDTPAVQEWLFANSYPALEVGDNEFHLAIVGRPERPLVALATESAWREVTVSGLRSLPTLQPGEVLPGEVSMTGRVDGSLKLSLRLLDPTGEVIAQQDQTVTPGFRFGLLLPPDAPPGEYTLAGVLYDPATLEPIPAETGDEQPALVTVSVDAAP